MRVSTQELEAAVVMVDDHMREIHVNVLRVRVTVKLQLVLVPQESLAVQVTVVVPTGNVLPLGGLQLTDGGGLHPQIARALSRASVQLWPVAGVVTLNLQSRQRVRSVAETAVASRLAW